MRLRSIFILVGVLAAAAAVYLVTRPPEAIVIPPDPPEYVWLFDMEDLQHILIELPNLEMSESFLKHEDRMWYFDDPPGPRADSELWGGGIPLLLSGPAAERPIARDATEEQLASFGFTQPLMILTLTTMDAETWTIEVGDSVPDGHAYYVRLADSDDVYTVDGTWYEVLERIVTEPPYPPEEEDEI